MLSFQLNKEFTNEYRIKPEPFGYNGLGAVTFYRTYSRQKDDGTYESWVDVCERVINGMYSIQKDHCIANNRPWSDSKAQESAKEAFDRMFNFKWTPSGRGMWMVGTPFIHERKVAEALMNCFSGTTKIITKEYGAVALHDISGEYVNVWTEKGWAAAEINSFGKQQLNKITFAPADIGAKGPRKLRTNTRIIHDATPNHKWILHDNSETTELRIGDYVKSSRVVGNSVTPEYRAGFQHGIIFGDGQMSGHHYVNGDFGFLLRACDQKMQNAAGSIYDLFDVVNLSTPSHHGDPNYFVRSSTNMKEYPKTNDSNYIAGFIAGWITADGSVTPTGNEVLASSKPGAYEWLLDNAALGGYIISGISYDNRETNFGKRTFPLAKITLKQQNNALWVVTNIEELDEDEVYCATVPSVGRFTLASGIYTGNCAFISTQTIAEQRGLIFEWFMEMLMLGVGVGGDVRGESEVFIGKPEDFKSKVIIIEDSREGWARSVGELIDSYLYDDKEEYNSNTLAPKSIVTFDYSQIRPAGAPIKGFGGISSGPEPLIKLHQRIREYLDKNAGFYITTRTIVDIFNAIGACVIAGNVRRSAEIMFGDFENDQFKNLKNYTDNPERSDIGWVSNNSLIANIGSNYSSITKSIMNNGEPGLYWLENAQKYGRMGELMPDNAIGGNPCMEQPLADKESCNLVEVYMNNHTDLYDYLRTLKFAYLYGKTMTLTYDWITDYDARKIMQKNRRIGLSNTGIAQFKAVNGIGELIKWYDTGYKYIRHYDMRYSEWFGINESIRVTTIKPSGTVSLLAGATPGIHHPISEYYIRRIRIQNDTPLLKILKNCGLYTEADSYSDNTTVVEFPIHVGSNVKSEKQLSIWEQFELTAITQQYWADNAVSVTIKVDPNKNTEEDIISVLEYYQYRLKGVSLLPEPEEGAYEQMPYQAITKEEYDNIMINIDFTPLQHLGRAMNQSDKLYELYCTNDSCEIPIKKKTE